MNSIYKFSATGVFGYVMYSDSGQIEIGRATSLVLPEPNVRIYGKNIEMYCDFTSGLHIYNAQNGVLIAEITHSTDGKGHTLFIGDLKFNVNFGSNYVFSDKKGNTVGTLARSAPNTVADLNYYDAKKCFELTVRNDLPEEAILIMMAFPLINL